MNFCWKLLCASLDYTIVYFGTFFNEELCSKVYLQTEEEKIVEENELTFTWLELLIFRNFLKIQAE